MKIVVNHLTRLKQGYICVAGLDLETHKHVRPVLRASLITKAFAAHNGGYFELGGSLDLGRVEYAGCQPQTEDWRFEPARVRRLPSLKPAKFWQLQQSLAQDSLAAIFGPELKQDKKSGVVEEHCGQASLGLLRPSQRPRIFLDGDRGLRLALGDGSFDLDLAVTDLRYYGPDYQTLNQPTIEEAIRRCESGDELLLSVGLTRLWKKEGECRARHWLQVNNLHFGLLE